MSSRRRWIVIVVAAIVVISAAGVAFVKLRGDDRQPEKAAEYVRRGNTALAAKDIKQARSLFTKAISYDDKSADAHYDLGYVFQVYDNKAMEAQAEYRKAIGANGAFTKALYSLAILRARAQDTEEAMGLYRRVIQIDPTYAEAHFNLGLLLIDGGQSAAGHAEIDKAVQLKPELGAHIATTTTTTVKPKK